MSVWAAEAGAPWDVPLIVASVSPEPWMVRLAALVALVMISPFESCAMSFDPVSPTILPAKLLLTVSPLPSTVKLVPLLSA